MVKTDEGQGYETHILERGTHRPYNWRSQYISEGLTVPTGSELGR